MANSKNRKKRIGNLSNISDIIREAKRVYREARNNEISPEDMVRFGQILHKISQMIEAGDLEQRILELEQNAQTK